MSARAWRARRTKRDNPPYRTTWPSGAAWPPASYGTFVLLAESVPVRRVELARERHLRTLQWRLYRRSERYFRHHPLTYEERLAELRGVLDEAQAIGAYRAAESVYNFRADNLRGVAEGLRAMGLDAGTVEVVDL